jgi:hypothetical protein
MTTLRVGMGTQIKRCVPRCPCAIVFDETAPFTLGHHRALQRRIQRASQIIVGERGTVTVDDHAETSEISRAVYDIDTVDQYSVQERVDGTDS